MEQAVLSLERIIENNSTTDDMSPELDKLQTLFEAQGWAFLRMPQDTVSLAKSAQTQLERFFEKPIEDVYRYQLSNTTLGLRDTSHKISLSCASGTELKTSIDKFLPSESEDVKRVCLHMAIRLDDHLIQIAKATSEAFFGMSPSELGKKMNVALLDDHQTESNPKTLSNFGLFDVAYYKNNESLLENSGTKKKKKRSAHPNTLERVFEENTEKTGEGENCAEHYDPGLYSLWVGETQPGLKLLDGTGQWVSPHPDDDVFVLWLGKTAQDANSRFTPAKHRVDIPYNLTKNSNDGCDNGLKLLPRLSMWTELCTRNQIAPHDSVKFTSANVIEVVNARYGDGDDNLRVRVESGNLDKALLTIGSILRMPLAKVVTIPHFDEEGCVVRIGSPDFERFSPDDRLHGEQNQPEND